MHDEVINALFEGSLPSTKPSSLPPATAVYVPLPPSSDKTVGVDESTYLAQEPPPGRLERAMTTDSEMMDNTTTVFPESAPNAPHRPHRPHAKRGLQAELDIHGAANASPSAHSSQRSSLLSSTVSAFRRVSRLKFPSVSRSRRDGKHVRFTGVINDEEEEEDGGNMVRE